MKNYDSQASNLNKILNVFRVKSAVKSAVTFVVFYSFHFKENANPSRKSRQ